MKKQLLAVTVAFLAGSSAWASSETPAGTTALSINKIKTGARATEIRKEIEAIDKDNIVIETQIREARNQGQTYRSIPGSTQVGQFEALEQAYQMKRDQNIAQRAKLRAELSGKN